MYIADRMIDGLENFLSGDKLNILMVGEKTSLDIPLLIKKISGKGIRIAGGIFPMVMSGEQYYESGVVLNFAEPGAESFLFRDIGKGNIAHQLPEKKDYNSAIVLVDGLMQYIPGFLERLYEKYWHHINFIGAGCGSLSLKQTPCVFNNEGVFQDAGIMIMLPSKLQLGAKHGWEKIGGPFLANKTDKNTILELNWKPAFQVYRDEVEKYSGLSIEDKDFFEIAKGYPFGIFKEGEEYTVRDPIATTKNGFIECVGEISENVSLYILEGSNSSLIRSAGDAVEIATKNVSFKKLIVMDCISRALYLGDDFKNELQEIKNRLSGEEEIPFEGALSIGEISSMESGYLEFLNKTVVVGAVLKE